MIGQNNANTKTDFKTNIDKNKIISGRILSFKIPDDSAKGKCEALINAHKTLKTHGKYSIAADR